MPLKKNSGLWAYLEQQGKIGLSGEELVALKKAYRKQYEKEYKRSHRARNKQHCVSFNPSEEKTVRLASTQHGMKEAEFIKKAVWGYLDNVYVIQNKEAVDRILQMLLRYQTAIERTEEKNTSTWFKPDRRTADLVHLIPNIQKEVKEVLMNPPKLADLVRQALIDNPSFRQTLLTLLDEHDT